MNNRIRLAQRPSLEEAPSFVLKVLSEHLKYMFLGGEGNFANDHIVKINNRVPRSVDASTEGTQKNVRMNRSRFEGYQSQLLYA